ncbi:MULTISPECIES: capsule biosynthesis GfcC family protein [unclassified Vibrio]|uniref:capsule biosynthesis GfcC family protein n=1 Tax=unclassified Vibrio TaxID=2614977 RepID=UPI001481E224|nr:MULTISPECIES: capsule biosynthesis GfcC family protein [unclassified Vibrio]NNN45430.1 hypothetical protein [Vibrio sp. 1-1(7)]NNN73286.1 hypothetical protein [Vibrio sp. 12-2(3-a)]
MRFITLLCAMGWLGFSLPLLANTPISQGEFVAQVSVAGNTPSVTLVADGPVRLDAMVLQALQSQPTALSTLRIDWQNSRLFCLHEPFPLAKTLLRTLAEWQNRVPEPQASAWQQLRNELRKRHFAKRALITLDPDIIRVVSGHNPLLRGQFSLYLPLLGEHQTVTVLGAVRHSEPQVWQATFSAGDYAQRAQWLQPTLGEVSVIQPNGDVEAHPVGYWNAQPLTILPGAIIYVPFSAAFGSTIDRTELAHLNQQVVELLRHQLPRE